MSPVEQEAGMPVSLRLRMPDGFVLPDGAHLSSVWWHQRTDEPDEFMHIAYDVAMDSIAGELSIPFADVALPFEENLICYRACRDRAVCACEWDDDRFALASILIAIDRDGDGLLSLDEIRSEQIGSSSSLIAWSPVTTPTVDVDAILNALHRGFAAYTPEPSAPFVAVTSSSGPPETLSLCAPNDRVCSLPVNHIFCAQDCERDWGLNRFGF